MSAWIIAELAEHEALDEALCDPGARDGRMRPDAAHLPNAARDLVFTDMQISSADDTSGWSQRRRRSGHISRCRCGATASSA